MGRIQASVERLVSGARALSMWAAQTAVSHHKANPEKGGKWIVFRRLEGLLKTVSCEEVTRGQEAVVRVGCVRS